MQVQIDRVQCRSHRGRDDLAGDALKGVSVTWAAGVAPAHNTGTSSAAFFHGAG